MPYLREIWHFKPKRLLHQGLENSSIAKFFSILLQYNSKYRIFLFIVLQKNIYIFYAFYFTRNFSLIPFIFSILFYLFLLCSPSALSSLKLHRRNFSPISEISHPSYTTSLSSLIAWPLFHCTSAGFWIF